ncbi:MAG: chorismate synthase [Muribaculaceae bacterium]|nr:chorismate synthase [Muribaculaceae bacterium]
MSNSFGNIYRLTTFGESHGLAIGGVIDGVPAGFPLDIEAIQHQLNRRRPGQSALTTSRNEADKLVILSGVFEGQTTGAPIGFVVENSNQHSADYDSLRNVYRPSHADYTYQQKYGIRDHRGGGRSSARVTIPQVVAGAIAMQILATQGIKITAWTDSVGNIKIDKHYSQLDLSTIDSNSVRCPDSDKAIEMERLILEVKNQGDTIGGTIECVVSGCPVGLGQPVFGKLQSMLAAAMLGINAAKGFEYGMGFEGCAHRGSEMNDSFVADASHENGISTSSNHSGGIQGGISNGQDIYFKVAFKPVATLLKEIATIDQNGYEVALKAKGRHDPCVLPRAVPVVESMAACVILDALLMNRCAKI